ncbi:neural/ectodermal development factor IMP-L2 [Bacillus rossius redtenbacheri]|uniref:neural/ectodermal development factor IMP-L2 n=1 Tax=Bacillus rossius redtenbacheri TaxID=93214 RepID=UPI002FDE9917
MSALRVRPAPAGPRGLPARARRRRAPEPPPAPPPAGEDRPECARAVEGPASSRRGPPCECHRGDRSRTNSFYVLTNRMSCRSRIMIVVCLACWVIAEECWAAKLSANRVNLMDQNSLRPQHQLSTRTLLRSKDWVKITESPEAVISSQLGERVELNCEAIGSPAPSIHWVQGLTPLAQGEGALEDNAVTNDVGLASGGMAKVRSRLVLDCVMPRHEQPYTCVASAAGQTAVAAPAMLLVEDGGTSNLTALLSACPGSRGSAARITGWSPLYMDNMGNDVALQCSVQGRPRPQVYWLDGDSGLVANTQPRYKVLPSGDLLIEKLRWADMGTYTCVAANAHSKDAATTFLYPVLNEER